MHWLTETEIDDAISRARRFQGAWTGTAGTLALYVFHLAHMVRTFQENTANMETIICGAQQTAADRLLETARRTVGERRATYGPPGEHFAKTVAAVNAIFADKLREPLTTADWAQIMILDKLARHQGTNRSADTPVDLAGYAACLAEVEAAG